MRKLVKSKPLTPVFGKISVVLIEAQVGGGRREYTGEDDIVRIEDDFKRY